MTSLFPSTRPFTHPPHTHTLHTLPSCSHQTRASEYEFSSKYMAAEEAVRAVDAELARSRQRCGQLEASLRVRDSEIARLTKRMCCVSVCVYIGVGSHRTPRVVQ